MRARSPPPPIPRPARRCAPRTSRSDPWPKRDSMNARVAGSRACPGEERTSPTIGGMPSRSGSLRVALRCSIPFFLSSSHDLQLPPPCVPHAHFRASDGARLGVTATRAGALAETRALICGALPSSPARRACRCRAAAAMHGHGPHRCVRGTIVLCAARACFLASIGRELAANGSGDGVRSRGAKPCRTNSSMCTWIRRS